MDDMLKKLQKSTEESLYNVKLLENAIEFKRDAGLSVAEDLNRLLPLKRQAIAFARALEKRGISPNYNGVKL